MKKIVGELTNAKIETDLRLTAKRATFMVVTVKKAEAMKVLAKENALGFSFMAKEERVEKKILRNIDL